MRYHFLPFSWIDFAADSSPGGASVIRRNSMLATYNVRSLTNVTCNKRICSAYDCCLLLFRIDKLLVSVEKRLQL